jgi:hypothetical protein
MKTTKKSKDMLQCDRKLSRPMTMAAIMLAGWAGMVTADAQSAPIVILDTYIGGTPTHSYYTGQDIIGSAELFDISRMEVSFLPAETMTIDIYSRYLNNIGAYWTQLGDLFLSTDGYQGEGEQWEYALKLDNHLPTTTSGTISLYGVQTANIVMSSAPSGYIYRKGQEVQYGPAGQTSLATGSWTLNNIGGTDTDDYLRFTLAYDFGNVSTYGLHWGMTCGNDVIEGAAPVPEPSAMLLFGVGMIGLGGVLRRKLNNHDEIRMK